MFDYVKTGDKNLSFHIGIFGDIISSVQTSQHIRYEKKFICAYKIKEYKFIYIVRELIKL